MTENVDVKDEGPGLVGSFQCWINADGDISLVGGPMIGKLISPALLDMGIEATGYVGAAQAGIEPDKYGTCTLAEWLREALHDVTGHNECVSKENARRIALQAAAFAAGVPSPSKPRKEWK